MSKFSRSALVLSMALIGCMSAMAVSASASTAGDRASILVKVEPNVDPNAVAARNGMAVVRYFPEIHWAEMVALDAEEANPAQLRVLRAADVPANGAEAEPPSLRALGGVLATDPGVRSVDTVTAGEKLSWDYVPSDPLFRSDVLIKEGLQAAWHFTLPGFPIAWDTAKGGGVLVAVIDSEFDTTNTDLRDKLVQRYNVTAGTLEYRTANVNPLPGDAAHGSHVAGLVGATTNNGSAVAGACHDCGILAIKVKTGGVIEAEFIANVVEGLLYAANNGARVVNMSFGSSVLHQPLLDAVNHVASRGIVMVGSAGNDQETKAGEINYPGAYPNVIGVGATDSQDQIASFSRQGPWVDVSAPGHEVVSTTSANDEEQINFGGVLVSIKSGTSMAAPIVAGLAGLMLSARPDLTPPEVEGLMKTTARDLGIAGPDIIYGAGRIDAAAAVAAAKAYVRPVPPPPPVPVKKKVRKFGARVVVRVKLREGKVSYLGKVVSRKKPCQKKRVVYLRAKRAKKPLVKSKTTKRGGFRMSLKQRPKKRVQVVVKAKKIGPRAVCKGAKSQFVN